MLSKQVKQRIAKNTARRARWQGRKVRDTEKLLRRLRAMIAPYPTVSVSRWFQPRSDLRPQDLIINTGIVDLLSGDRANWKQVFRITRPRSLITDGEVSFDMEAARRFIGDDFITINSCPDMRS
jgi:hypothetical protein